MLKSFEGERKKKLSKFCIILGISIITTAIPWINGTLLYSSDDSVKFLNMLIFIIGVLGTIVSAIFYSLFAIDVKSKYLKEIIGIFGDIKSVINNITDSELRQSELFPNFEFNCPDDCFIGKYKGVNFKIANYV